MVALVNRHLHCTLAKDLSTATARDFYLSLAYTIRDHVMSGWIKTQKECVPPPAARRKLPPATRHAA